jgi:hypothetical protein
MKKVISEIGSPGVQEIKQPNLTLLRDLCPDYAALPAKRLPDGFEVLVKQPNKIGGFTYIYPDFSYRVYQSDGKPAADNHTGRIKLCQEATGKVSPTFGPDMQSAVNALKQKNRGLVELSSDIVGKISTGEYKPVDLSTLDKVTFSTPNKWFLYEKTGIKTSSANIPQSIETIVNKYNLTFSMPDDIEEQRDKAVYLVNEIPALRDNSDVKKWAIQQKIPIDQVKVWKTAAYKEQNIDKGDCKDKIRELAKLSVCNQKPAGRGNCTATIKKMGAELDKLKKKVAGCLSDGKKFRQFMGIGLKSEINRLANTESSEYDNELGVGRELEAYRQNASGEGVTLNESYDRHLKQLVREHLTRLSNSKKKSVITNKKVVREHFLKIVNSKINKTEKINRIVSEGYSMINSGVNEKLINEEFEWLSNLLGIGGKGVISTFKTNIAKKLIDKFIPGGSDSWLGGIVANAIGNIPLGDYFNGNILKCDFVSKEITKSISEEVLTKVQQNKDLTGGFYDVIKNSLMEYIDDTPFFNKIQEGVSTMICPYMDDISGSLGKAFGSVTGDLKQEFTGTK